jgi:outer membrane protein OmpA-like peptidoglycan-associated protein
MTTRRIYTAAILLVGLSSCMTYDPYTQEKGVSKATTGAAIGAGVAAIGAAIINRDDDPRSRNQRVLIAAAAGGALGGGAGYYMDRQEAKLRASMQNTGVSVMREGDNLILVMPGNVTFASGSSAVRGDFEDVLVSVASVLKEFDKTLLEITGHTDSTGSDSSNLQLSESRARSVANSLQRQGVLVTRMLTQGFGESRPVASNETDSGRQANRRVELVLIPIA